MAQDGPDYYEILGLQRGASDAEIKRSYRKLAMRWHPDRVSKENLEEASSKFQEIGEAYDVLSDQQKRAVYDQYGYEALRDGVPDASGNVGEGYAYGQNAQEIFESFFGTRNPFADFGFGESMPFASRLKKPGPKKADPIIHELPCSLEELFNGCVKRLKITRKRFGPEGFPKDQTKELVITVKPGWKKGTRVTFPSEGDEAAGMVPADVIFVVAEKNHARFVREGSNLVHTCTLSLADALTECVLQVPTLDGRKLSLACPEIVSPGYEKIIPGEGMPLSKQPHQRGNLVIRFKLVFPVFLPDDKQKQLRELLVDSTAAAATAVATDAAAAAGEEAAELSPAA